MGFCIEESGSGRPQKIMTNVHKDLDVERNLSLITVEIHTDTVLLCQNAIQECIGCYSYTTEWASHIATSERPLWHLQEECLPLANHHVPSLVKFAVSK